MEIKTKLFVKFDVQIPTPTYRLLFALTSIHDLKTPVFVGYALQFKNVISERICIYN
jgi:hypothetical protein